jgi:hypothetical protein
MDEELNAHQKLVLMAMAEMGAVSEETQVTMEEIIGYVADEIAPKLLDQCSTLRAELAARDAEIARLRKETVEDRLAELCVLPNVENVSLEPPTGCGCCYDANQWKCYWDGFGGYGEGNTAIEAIDSAIRAALGDKP